jgi:uncharacterized protein YpmB
MSMNKLRIDKINKLLMFTIIVLIIFIGLIGAAYADNMLNDYTISKKSANEWRNYAKDNNLGYGSNLWTINTFLDDSLYDYSKDFWMPIQPWEYMVCSRGLSTQLVDEGGVTAAGGGIYQGVDSISVAAYRRVTSSNDTFLYEITWYIQPSGRGYYYTIDAKSGSSTRVIQAKEAAYQRTGDTGYLPFYDKVNYTEIVLKYLDKEHRYPIIEVKDANRQ